MSVTDDIAIRNALSSVPRPPRPSAFSAAMTFGWRGMLKIKHVPEQLLDVTITPVMFLLMFTYLFGGAIARLDRRVPGLRAARPARDVRACSRPSTPASSLNTDLTKGAVDRFRTLPIWRPAPLLGALLGDAVRYVIAGTVIIDARA